MGFSSGADTNTTVSLTLPWQDPNQGGSVAPFSTTKSNTPDDCMKNSTLDWYEQPLRRSASIHLLAAGNRRIRPLTPSSLEPISCCLPTDELAR